MLDGGGGGSVVGNTYPIKIVGVTPGSVSGMSAAQIEALFAGLDPGAVARAGAAYTAASKTLAQIADSLAQHVQLLSSNWTGSAAQAAAGNFAQLHTTAIGLARASAQTGSVLTWLGTTILPFYKAYKAPGNGIVGDVESLFGHNPANSAAQQVLARLNNRLVQANAGLPPDVTKQLPSGSWNGSPGPLGTSAGGGGSASAGGGGAVAPAGGQIAGGGVGGGNGSPGSLGRLSGGAGPAPKLTVPRTGSGPGPGPIGRIGSPGPVSPGTPVRLSGGSPPGPVPGAPGTTGVPGPGPVSVGTGPGGSGGLGGVPGPVGIVPGEGTVPGEGVVPGDGVVPGAGVVPGETVPGGGVDPAGGVEPASGIGPVPGVTEPGAPGVPGEGPAPADGVVPGEGVVPGAGIGPGVGPVGPGGAGIPGEGGYGPGGYTSGLEGEGIGSVVGADDPGPFGADGMIGGMPDGSFAARVPGAPGSLGDGAGPVPAETAADPAAGYDPAAGMPMAGSASRRQEEQERYRQAWLAEDAELWDAAPPTVPSSLGV